MTDEDPFSVLGIEPTLDAAPIKRGYFAALAKVPPHVDPEGFRRLRAAYEALATEEERALAFMRAPIDQDAELARFDAIWGERIAAEGAAARRTHEACQAVDRFLDRLAHMTFDDVVDPRRS